MNVKPAFAVAVSVTELPEANVPVPEIVPPLAGLAVAVIANDGGFTVTVAVPVAPPAEALIEADPAATPVTRPLVETLAIPGLFDAHETATPDTGAPCASSGVAVSCVDPLTAIDVDGGDTETDDTFDLTVMSPPPPPQDSDAMPARMSGTSRRRLIGGRTRC